MRVFLLLLCAWAAQGKVFFDKSDRYLIACHATDLECFKRQYSALRDHVLLGNAQLAIDQFEPYTVQYGNSCLQISGWKESKMTGIRFSNVTKVLDLVLELPVYIQQVENQTKCAKPAKEFTAIEERNPQNGDLIEFYGNATVRVSYPTSLLKKKGEVYLILGEEDLDIVVDLPIYVMGEQEAEVTALNEASKWAHNVVQHIDAATTFALPFTSRLRVAMKRIPYRRLMLLYPEEEYSDIQFSYIDLEL